MTTHVRHEFIKKVYVVVALVCVVSMAMTVYALTVSVAIQSESGTLSGGGVSQVADTSASSATAVKFSQALSTPVVPANPIPSIETQTFSSSGDIADDSAIYADPNDPSKSVVIADNKHDTTGGIGVFSMQGSLLQFRQDGKIGNVDLRPGFTLGSRSIVLVGGNNRSNDTIMFWEYNPTTQRLTAPIGSTSSISPNYGFCMYHSAVSGKYYAFVTQETGSSTMEQYELYDSNGSVAATKVRTFNVGSITEGCVADDDLGKLYVAQEDVGLWIYDAEPTGGSSRSSVGSVGDGHLVADVEGVSIAKGASNTGYIVVSSQGSSSYVLYDRQTRAYLRTFTIGSNAGIDAPSETDGLDISTDNLGPGFEQGVLVVHDGVNTGSSTSNLKYIPLQTP